MRCVVTHEETSSHTNGIPLSKQGREILKDIITAHNDKVAAFFIEKTKGDNPNSALTDEGLKRFAPKVSTRQALNLLKIEESDIMETRAEVLEE
tara:strand:- start:774 stop:1055 length:282 start_codon:yes stop_codon:yes gene_type:complete